jgi:hypothetical protein
MRILIVASAIVLCAVSAQAQSSSKGGSSYAGFGTGSNSSSHGVEGYSTNQGTYVQPHQQTNPNSTQYDNYGARGNVNPYTGQTGSRPPKY